LVAALVSGFLIGVDVYIPMWMQGLKGLKAAMGGFAITPMSFTWVLGSFIAGQLMLKQPVKTILTSSLVITSISALIIIQLPLATPFYVFLLVTAIIGLGMGLAITTTTVTIQNIVPKNLIGVATSVNTLFRILGQTIMISIYGIILNKRMAEQLIIHQSKGVESKMMNELINPLTAINLDPTLLPILRDILYVGIHDVFFYGFITVLLALIINQFDKKVRIY
ncbi:MAG: MFS transporter, partial [Carnobacterium sp.]|nr:MFS transporter [Carnobacterium sp.]